MRTMKYIVAVLVICMCALPVFAQDAMEGEAMESGEVTGIMHHKVADFEKWTQAFEAHADFRAAAGCTGISTYQAADDPNSVTVIATFESLEKAQAFVASPDLKEKMEAAGVMGPPEIHFVHKFAEYAH